MFIKSIVKKIMPAFVKKAVRKCLQSDNCEQMGPYKYVLNVQHLKRAENKAILVTGGTGAIGSAICYRMATEGAVVGVSGRSREKIDFVINTIKQSVSDAKLVPVVLDVTDEKSIMEAISDFVSSQGKIDVLVNNAGGGARDRAEPLRNQQVSVIDSVLDTNLRGAILCAKYASSVMVRQKYGKIISMSSVMGMNGKENWSEYSASKSGILGLTKSLALELGEYDITVNSVSPGMVLQTPFDRGIPRQFSHTNALKRFGYTDEVASLVAFLCSDEANYITGQNFVIDGGRSIGLK